MLSEKQINITNKILSKKVFTYSGPIFSNEDGIVMGFDYKISLSGYKKMITVGEYMDYIKVDVTIIKFNSDFLKKINDDGVIKNIIMNSEVKYRLLDEIKSILTIFTGTNRGVLLSSISVAHSAKENIQENIITEKRMSKQAIRDVVRDIVNVIKNGKKGFFYLPDNDLEYYEFTNLPFNFNVELTLKTNNKMAGYKMNGFYSPEDDVIEIIVLFNPKTVQKELYSMIGELNEIIAHELEHGYQEYHGEFPDRHDNEVSGSLEYYTQEHEIPAQYQGFKRLAQLRKEPISMVAKNWFDSHKDIHGLTDDETKIVLDKILNYKK